MCSSDEKSIFVYKNLPPAETRRGWHDSGMRCGPDIHRQSRGFSQLLCDPVMDTTSMDCRALQSNRQPARYKFSAC
jgi:hypothetical protein